MKESSRHLLLLHFVVFIFGFTGILGELIKIPSTLIVSYRMVIAVTVLLIFFFFSKKRVAIQGPNKWYIIATGILIAVHWSLFFEAIQVSTVSVTLAVLSSATLFTALLEPLVHRRRIIGYELLLGILVIGGLYLIFNFETQYARGIIYTLISALAASMFTVLNGIFAKKYDAVSISLYELSGGGLMIVLYVLFSTGTLLPPVTIPAIQWFYLILLGTVCTAFAYVASVRVMKVLTPYTVTMTINLEPLYGILLALLIFGEKERLSAGFYSGAILILAAVFLNGWLKSRTIKNKTIHENINS